MEGNQNGLKLKDPKLRLQAYLQYCDHLAKGKSKRSWYFQHPDHRCTWETMESYIKKFSDELDLDLKDIAMAKGFGVWEQIVEDSATGANPDANTASLQMIMRNKFGWDARDKNEDEKNAQLLEAFGLAIESFKSLPKKIADEVQ